MPTSLRLAGLESQTELDTLNLNKNFLSKIENLSHMKRLTTLLISNNQLKTADDIRHVSGGITAAQQHER